jgi:hypothetical protein
MSPLVSTLISTLATVLTEDMARSLLADILRELRQADVFPSTEIDNVILKSLEEGLRKGPSTKPDLREIDNN